MSDGLIRVDLTGHRDTKVALFTHWNQKYHDLAQVAIPNFRDYCNKHQYFLRGYINYHEDPEHPETYGDKGKFRYYVDLRGHFELVAFIDIDSLFVDMEIKIENLIENKSFSYGYDENGPNSSFWIAQTDDFTEHCLRYAYEYAGVNNNIRHGVIEPNGISDQDAMTRLMAVPPFRKCFGNCVSWDTLRIRKEETYQEGNTYILTFAGLPYNQKLERAKWWRDIIG